ncbi:MAG: hypothetical protein V4524_00860 [Patescibacteria group bacterium]
MISKEEYFGLGKGDLVQAEDGIGRWHVLYTRPTSRPEEKQVIFESPTGNIHDTTLVGDNVKLLAEKNAMLA